MHFIHLNSLTDGNQKLIIILVFVIQRNCLCDIHFCVEEA